MHVLDVTPDPAALTLRIGLTIGRVHLAFTGGQAPKSRGRSRYFVAICASPHEKNTMSNRILLRLAAFVLLIVPAMVINPGCVITIGPGTGEDDEMSSAQTGGSGAGTGGSAAGAGGPTGGGGSAVDSGEALTAEEQAAIEALENADPVYYCGRGDLQIGVAFRLITRFPLPSGDKMCIAL